MRPWCFDHDWQWHGWKLAAILQPPRPRNGYCEDCTPTYKAAMVKANRCEHPSVTFNITAEDDGLDIEGVRP